VLKIALLVENETLAAWQLRIVELIHESNCAKISAIIVNNSAATKQSALQKAMEHRGKLVWKAHEALDHLLLKPARNPFARKPMPDYLSQVKRVHVTPRLTKHCDYLLDEDVATIKALDLDVALRFGFRIIKGEFLNIAKHGIWSYHHADNRTNRGTPPGYWEVVNKENLTGVTLQILQPELDGGLVIYKSWSATHKVSISRNKATIYWKAVRFIPRKLKQLHEQGADAFFEAHREKQPEVYDRELFLVPSNFVALRKLLGHLAFLAKDALQRFWYQNQWVLIYSFNKELQINPRKFKQITPPKNAFWADPFACSHHGRYYIFFEEYPYKTKLGRLAAIEIDKKGNQLAYHDIMDQSYHLSYPCLLQHEEGLFMIPETGENKTIDLYKCTDFPATWEHQTTLMKDVVAIDTTLFFHDDVWWMFTTMQEEKGASKNEELFLFYADRFDSQDWQAHPQNPIVSDVRHGRMAGRIQQWKGKIMRMAQDGEKGYGGAIGMYEITQLSKTAYAESKRDTIEANWGNGMFRTHTLDANEDFIVMDALRKIPRWF